MAISYLRNAPVRANPTIQPVSLALILKTCRSHDVAHTRFGREAVKDPRLVHDMQLGRQPGKRTLARVAAYIATLEAC